MTFVRANTFEPRPVEFLELLDRDGWRIKIYSIVFGDQALDRAIFADGLEVALRELPRPAAATHRPGVGFAICHQGNGWDYLVVCWWDNENELPMHIYVRPRDSTSAWRRASESQSICVWDIQVINFERDAYVKCILSPEQSQVEEYVEDRM